MEDTFILTIFFIGLFSLIGLIFYLSYIQNKKKIERFNYFVRHYGLTPNDEAALQVYMGRSSFSHGSILVGASGLLKLSGNRYGFGYQSETRKKGKNSVTYERTIFAVSIPDTQLHMIINSKLANDQASGGNLQNYAKQQRYVLEGDFGQFYDVYMPSSTQVETLSLLAPDVMLWLLRELAYQDIEINGDMLYVYSYKHEGVDELMKLIERIDRCITEMKLRPVDVRVERGTQKLVARTAADESTAHRSLQKKTTPIAVGIIVIFVSFLQFLPSDLYALIIPTVMFIGLISAIIYSLRVRSVQKKYDTFIKKNDSHE